MCLHSHVSTYHLDFLDTRDRYGNRCWCIDMNDTSKETQVSMLPCTCQETISVEVQWTQWAPKARKAGEVIGLASYLYHKNIYVAEPTRTQDRDGIVICVAPVLTFKTGCQEYWAPLTPEMVTVPVGEEKVIHMTREQRHSHSLGEEAKGGQEFPVLRKHKRLGILNWVGSLG